MRPLRRKKQSEAMPDVEAELERARNELTQVIREESELRAGEIKRLLARERADFLSKLQEEERRIVEERRRIVAEQEQRALADLSASLTAIQQRVQHRLATWSTDLERAKQSLTAELAQLSERQPAMIAEAESRLNANREKIDEAAELQSAAFAKLREELEHAAERAAASIRTELETHAAEGRRTAEELNQRLKARDKRMVERIEREEADAARRVQARFADVERRQLESLERATNQATGRFAEAAALQFEHDVKNAREDAARRLARELDRAVHMFAREAESVLADRLPQVADTGAQRVEKRLRNVTAGLERQRDEIVGSLQERFAQLELELRERMRTLVADAEAERAVLERRIHELARRADEAGSVPTTRR
jgi:hypothetical protein